MKKPLNKFNKKELYELAKQNKDTIRILNFKLGAYTLEVEGLSEKLGNYAERVNNYKRAITDLKQMVKRKEDALDYFRDKLSKIKDKKSNLTKLRDYFNI